ncbi:SDR family oxidoreductase [Halodesulfovibrio spirochaetisodalis]|uniref:Oxidoreductase n=1 Tax=Halodesulfovibrio spirochaetisodalis TaxID=1560234 RepID=A0A1B7XPR8_9BACT|nr:SDR family oxidoreductase [Halodesulfovibrio spirochaetisodalis]OBQ57514.1 oxidoreductase [Halodesulfovibrio spirochaetisodalis]
MSKPLVVITGASSGFGEVTARMLSEKGYPLLLVARRLDRMKALNLPNTICAQVDVTDREALVKAITDAEATYGPVDCIINNAGVMLLGLTHEQDPAEWKKMVDVNMLGVLNGIYAVLPSMRERKTGTIINISSVAGRKTFPNHAIYCGTKFAVHAMSENIREEVASDNVRVIVIAPGAAETELLSHTTSDVIKEGYTQWKKQIGGVMSAKDVANSIVFAYEQPQSVCIREIVLAPTSQEP